VQEGATFQGQASKQMPVVLIVSAETHDPRPQVNVQSKFDLTSHAI
jgi:hypothetical protein